MDTWLGCTRRHRNAHARGCDGWGRRHAEAGDGLEAVQFAAQHRPDAILMDANLPRLDRIAAAERINAARPTPIVILTGYNHRDLVDHALDAGVTRYLVKPIAEQEIVPALSEALCAHDC